MIDQTKSPPISGSFISLGTFQFAKGKRDIVKISTEATEQTVIVDAIRLLPQLKSQESSDGNNVDDKKKEEVRSQQEGLELLVNELKSKIKAHQKNSPPKVVKVMSVLEHNLQVLEDSILNLYHEPSLCLKDRHLFLFSIFL